MANETQIQFISAEELRKVAELEKEERKLRTTDGMIDQMDAAHSMIDTLLKEDGQHPLMMKWAFEQPGEFFKLMARLKMHNKGEKHVHRIQIGLPMTELDAAPTPRAEPRGEE